MLKNAAELSVSVVRIAIVMVEDVRQGSAANAEAKLRPSEAVLGEAER